MSALQNMASDISGEQTASKGKLIASDSNA